MMKAKELASILLENPEFEVKFTVHKEVSDTELRDRDYKYPYDNYVAEFQLEDIGYSDQEICFGCNLDLGE